MTFEWMNEFLSSPQRGLLVELITGHYSLSSIFMWLKLWNHISDTPAVNERAKRKINIEQRFCVAIHIASSASGDLYVSVCATINVHMERIDNISVQWRIYVGNQWCRKLHGRRRSRMHVHASNNDSFSTYQRHHFESMRIFICSTLWQSSKSTFFVVRFACKCK